MGFDVPQQLSSWYLRLSSWCFIKNHYFKVIYCNMHTCVISCRCLKASWSVRKDSDALLGGPGEPIGDQKTSRNQSFKTQKWWFCFIHCSKIDFGTIWKQYATQTQRSDVQWVLGRVLRRLWRFLKPSWRPEEMVLDPVSTVQNLLCMVGRTSKSSKLIVIKTWSSFLKDVLSKTTIFGGVGGGGGHWQTIIQNWFPRAGVNPHPKNNEENNSQIFWMRMFWMLEFEWKWSNTPLAYGRRIFFTYFRQISTFPDNMDESNETHGSK